MSTILTSEEIEILNRQNDDTLANWACDLNAWRWPSEIPNEEPLTIKLIDMPRRAALLEFIRAKIPQKELLRTHWKRQRLNMDDFEEFYHIIYESKDQSKIDEYHNRRRNEIIERANRPSLTGHPRSYYQELKEKKEKELGIELFGSVGFVKRESNGNTEWVNTFEENDKYKSIEAIFKYYGNYFGIQSIDMVCHENDGEEFRIWYAGK